MQVSRPHQIVMSIGSLVVLAISAFGGLYIARYGIDYQTIIILLGGITGVFALALGDTGIRSASIIWFLMFILGYRSTTIYQAVIHPLTIIIFGLLILMMLQRHIVRREEVQLNIPVFGWVFSIFWVWGFLLGYINGYSIGKMMTHVLNLSIMIPTFAVVSYVLKNKNYWKWSITAMVVASTLIAVLGALEWHVPAVKSILPGFSAEGAEAIEDLETGFVRPPFAFWGHPSATFICNMMLPLSLPLWTMYKRPLSRVILAFGIAANIYAVYLTGWRSMWATAMLTFTLMTILSRSWRALFMALIAAALLVNFAPPEATARFQTFIDALEGNTSEQDSSSQSRLHRIEIAEELAYERPWGSGLTASGWVHNDPLQMAADMGVLSVVAFGIWYIFTFLSTLLKYLRSPDPLTLGLIGSFFVIAAIFLTQPVYQHTQLMGPFWAIWALVYTNLKQSKTEEENSDGQSETHGSDSNLQLRNTPARLYRVG